MRPVVSTFEISKRLIEPVAFAGLTKNPPAVKTYAAAAFEEGTAPFGTGFAWFGHTALSSRDVKFTNCDGLARRSFTFGTEYTPSLPKGPKDVNNKDGPLAAIFG